MKKWTVRVLAGLCCVLWVCIATPGRSEPLIPQGVRVEWDISKAYRESTETRERICLNGLWQWLPVQGEPGPVPAADADWGFLKVPGPWPEIKHWLARESQRFYPGKTWGQKVDMGNVTMAWYQRKFRVPDSWTGRRIAVSIEYLNTKAAVYLDERKVGELWFPGGELEITPACQPGKTHRLTLLVSAIPLQTESLCFAAAEGAEKEEGRVIFRGLCGDVFLAGGPPGARISDAKVLTSVRKTLITVDAALSGLRPGASYHLRGMVSNQGKRVLEIKSPVFTSAELINGRIAFSSPWQDPALWDTDKTQNLYSLELSLMQEAGDVLDIFVPLRFGFREFWIQGREFFLNGSPIHLFVLPLDCAQISAATASYTGAKEVLTRMKEIGANAVYTHNYDCRPGVHLSFQEILRAADDVGVLVLFSLPHVKDYDWSAPGGEGRRSYREHTEWYIAHARNHPAVVMYVMNHNYTGYKDDQNPGQIDGVSEPRFRGAWGEERLKRRQQALEAAAIAKSYDSTRPVYHHSSGNLGDVYTINCYLNFVPGQERAEWFSHWAREGKKPLFLVEYGEPLSASWSIFRGNSRGKWINFWEEPLMHQYYYPEWGAAFRGDCAYNMTDQEKDILRFEAAQWRKRETFHHYDYPVPRQELSMPNLRDVQAEYIAQTWPAFRTLGISGFNLWDYEGCWQKRKSVATAIQSCEIDWEGLQRPGYSPDFIDPLLSRGFAYALKRSDWIANNRGKAILRYNQPLLACLTGKPSRFTSKDHIFYPGEKVEKQIVIINDSRRGVECECFWVVEITERLRGAQTVSVPPGEHRMIPVEVILPETVSPGDYKIAMRSKFTGGQEQEGSLVLHVMGREDFASVQRRTAVFDPQGQTKKLLDVLGITYREVTLNDDISGYDVFIIGREALTLQGLGPDLSRVREGLRVVIFEQNAEVLEERLGFRAQEYGMRRVFKRVSNHPALSNIRDEQLRDWRGEATLLPADVSSDQNPLDYPSAMWCGYKETRPWRCGCYGNVASVVVEKPARGDFLPILDCGFSLQYSPLLEYREGKGIILFCQVDVTGRTEADPAALKLAGNVIAYAGDYAPPVQRKAMYVGESEGLEHLQRAGVSITKYQGDSLTPEHVLVVGPGGGEELGEQKFSVKGWADRGGHVLTLGLDQEEANAVFGTPGLRLRESEYISGYFELPKHSFLAGVGPADAYCRDPRKIALVQRGAAIVGSGVLAALWDGRAVMCQVAPWDFNYQDSYNIKPTFRRTAFLLNRLLGNFGVELTCPLLQRVRNAPLPMRDGETLEDLLSALWIESDGKVLVLPSYWKGVPLSPSEAPPQGWLDPNFDDSRWRKILVPGMWEEQYEDCIGRDGTFLYRTTISVPPEMAVSESTLMLGIVKHEDWTWVNGTEVGCTSREDHRKDYWEVVRRYFLPAGTLHKGENTIAIKVNDVGGESGIKGLKVPDPKKRIEQIAAQYGEHMRWLTGLYLDMPLPDDDPYRYFRW